MGLLTDPSAGQSAIVKLLTKIYPALCVMLYIGGVIYFGCLAHRKFNGGTYFSENALLPGLVKSEFHDDSFAVQYHRELLDEMETHQNSIPYSWLLAKFRQLGLDAYTQNFTLNYPLGNQQSFSGKNVYGILRAPRAGSTEALVLSVPYRPPTSVHETTAASISIMMAFARFANREKYWAKDIIFLVTEHEQLGMQAWLEAYHGVSCGKEGVLIAGDMKGRAGAIQAAINLEFHAPQISRIDIKIEGLNGQLPNLDLFNLASKMCWREGVPYTFKGRSSQHLSNEFNDWSYAFHTMMLMASTQATGIPNGNHGLYYRFGIQALTLEGFVNKRADVKFVRMGRIIEHIFRSLNNLLERFHQSFFFYLLSSSDRYISIGLYMPAIGALVAVLFVKAHAKWSQLNKDDDKNTDSEDTKLTEEQLAFKRDSKVKLSKLSIQEWEDKLLKDIPNIPEDSKMHFGHIALIVVTIHGLGFFLKDLFPYYVTKLGIDGGYSTELSIYVGFAFISFLTIFISPFLYRPNYRCMIMLEIIALIELGTIFLCIAMYNISLAMFCAVLYVPFTVIMFPGRCKYFRWTQKCLWFMLHPFVLVNIIVTAYTFLMFPGDDFKENLTRAFAAIQHAMVYSIVDCIIYGNWLFSVICVTIVPTWFMFWHLSFFRPTKEDVLSLLQSEKNKLKKE
nr:glycosylphosphatidylinositol anchor attachment 1 protein [Onthophagus taurus]